MAVIALANVTLNAVNPMTDFLRKRDHSLNIRNYLDSYLLEKVGKDGGVNDSSVKRMFDMVATAADDGADVILITCTIFSPYAELFSKILSKPVVSPDQAMLDAVARRKGKTAIICTFTGTVEITRKMYQNCCHVAGVPDGVDMYVAEGALDALNEGDWDTFHERIRKKVRELDQEYDSIVLAQISMAGAAGGMELQHAKLFSSPESAYQTVCRMLESRVQEKRPGQKDGLESGKQPE